MRQAYWDHKTKPSTFVVVENSNEIYRGPFKEGYELFQNLNQNYSKEAQKYFTEPSQLTPCQSHSTVIK